MKVYKILSTAILLLCFNKTIAQQNFTRITKWLDSNTTEMGGRSILLIYKNGSIIYNHSVNHMNIRQKMMNRYIARKQGKETDLSDYTANFRQPVASCSKWFSAALVMTFIDDGKLKLTDTAGKYLPLLIQYGKGSITISDCLSHLTGIDEPQLKAELQSISTISTMDEAIGLLAAMPMDGKPGETFHYSNAGLQIAAAVCEKISGKGFRELFNERIAKPLNMINTDFGLSKVPLPAGGAISTPNDYLNFLVMILNKGTFNGKRILSEKSVAQMQVNRITPNVKITYSPDNAKGLGYGYGEWIMGADVVSSPGLFGSFPWVNNDKHYAAFLMTFYLNNTGRDERFNELKQLVNNAVSN